ncbi:MAG: hypothetical protein JW982_03335 [Spirochaetes bacterium]|nr:hypothetical protein [Spirochaetota bacterium]
MIIKITSQNQEILSKEQGFVVFLSLDIANSTIYKTSFPNNWMFHYSNFFEKTRIHFEKNNQVASSKIFKENGDEVIIIFFPSNRNDFIEIMNESIKAVETLTEYRKVLIDVGLDYKATLFCAGFSEPEPFSVYDKNENRSDSKVYLEFLYSDYKNYRMHRSISFPNGNHDGQPSSCVIGSIKQYDFIGPDIDIGFRISKYAEPNKLLVSDKIAFIYDNFFQGEYHFQINKMERLKGVWGDRGYPIIEYTYNQNSIDYCKLYNDKGNYANPDKFIEKLKNEFKE